MLSMLYDLALFLIGIFALPKLFWQLLYKKKNRQGLLQRFGFGLPSFPLSSGPIIWIHAVSVGETRAAIAFYTKMRQEFPDGFFLISSTTETGHAEAKRSLKEADFYFFLPFDFFWVIKRVVKKLHPDLLILVEGDYWYNLLKYSKKQGAKIALINGKISEKSTKRLNLIPFFSHKLFCFFDCLCVQSDRYRSRFLQLGVSPDKLTVTGNLKLDQLPRLLSLKEKKSLMANWGIESNDKIIVIGSTHQSEEEQLMAQMVELWKSYPTLKVILAPRHPERFTQVKAILLRMGIDVALSSQLETNHSKRLILIDQMGILQNCYAIADIAIVGGSFIDGVGGHNIFEPIQQGVAVFFGPYMHNQMDLVDLVLDANAGKQITFETLIPTILSLFQNPVELNQMALAALRLSQSTKGSTNLTIEKILSLILNRNF